MKAIIFDLDGVLVRTTHLHIRALSVAAMTICNIDINSIPRMLEISMVTTKEKIRTLQSSYNFSDEIAQDILSLKDRAYSAYIEELVVDSNVYETLDYILSTGTKTAIASNSRLKNIIHILEEHNLGKYFDVVVSAEDVKRRKPAPDILYEVYKRLQVDGINTLFVEDTDEGAQAGHDSPSTVIRVNSPMDLSVDLFKDWIEQCTEMKS